MARIHKLIAVSIDFDPRRRGSARPNAPVSPLGGIDTVCAVARGHHLII